MNGCDLLTAFAGIDEKYIKEAGDSDAVKTAFRRKKLANVRTASSVAAVFVLTAATVGLVNSRTETVTEEIHASVTAAVSDTIHTAKPSIKEENTGTASTVSGTAANTAQSSVTASVVPEAPSTTAPVMQTTPPAASTQVTVTAPAENSECYIIPRWNDKSAAEQYTEAVYGGALHTVGHSAIPEASLDARIGTVTLFGYDIYTDTNHEATGAAYAIKGISERCAIGVRFDDGTCYAYLNSEYVPETLGQFMSDLSLESNASFGQASKEYYNSEDGYHFVIYDDFDDSIIYAMLLTDPSLKNVEAPELPHVIADVSVSIPALGYENKALCVTEDGFLYTNLLETAKCFYIGKEKAAAFASYLDKNVPHSDTSPLVFNSGIEE